MRSGKVFLGIALILVGVCIFIWSTPKEEPQWEEVRSRQLIESLEQRNEELVAAYKDLDYKTFLLASQSDSLQRLLHTSKLEIEQINQSKDEKIRVMDSYAEHQLYEYFSGFNSQKTADK